MTIFTRIKKQSVIIQEKNKKPGKIVSECAKRATGFKAPSNGAGPQNVAKQMKRFKHHTGKASEGKKKVKASGPQRI